MPILILIFFLAYIATDILIYRRQKRRDERLVQVLTELFDKAESLKTDPHQKRTDDQEIH